MTLNGKIIRHCRYWSEILLKLASSASIQLAAGALLLGVFGLSCWESFRALAPFLPPAGEELRVGSSRFRVAMFGDFADSVSSMEMVAKDIGERKPDFALCLGDMTTEATPSEFRFTQREFKENFTVPLYAVPGNHDYSQLSGLRNYRQIFGQDHYWFGYGDTLFIGFDTSCWTMVESQLQWLETTLRRRRPDFRRCVIVTHVPPFDPFPGGERHLSENTAAELKTLIDSYRVDLLVTGHAHLYGKAKFGHADWVSLPSAGQGGRKPLAPSFGYVLFDFAETGGIATELRALTRHTGKEHLEYLLIVIIPESRWLAWLGAALIGIGIFRLAKRKYAGFHPAEWQNQAVQPSETHD